MYIEEKVMMKMSSSVHLPTPWPEPPSLSSILGWWLYLPAHSSCPGTSLWLEPCSWIPCLLLSCLFLYFTKARSVVDLQERVLGRYYLSPWISENALIPLSCWLTMARYRICNWKSSSFKILKVSTVFWHYFTLRSSTIPNSLNVACSPHPPTPPGPVDVFRFIFLSRVFWNIIITCLAFHSSFQQSVGSEFLSCKFLDNNNCTDFYQLARLSDHDFRKMYFK